MANNPSTLVDYNGQVDAPDANYTYGSARDDAVPGDLTGTPRVAAELKDLQGFQQALLVAAGVVPSGSADTVLVSQYLQSLFLVAGSSAITLVALKALEPLDKQLARMGGSASIGDGKGAVYVYDVASSATSDDKRIITPDGGTGRWLLVNDLLLDTLLMGDGVKGAPQTNVGVQIHRDITAVGTSSHGFNCADYFAEDTQALNPFGSDIQIGDDTQTTEVLNHVNSFQSTNQIDLNTADLSLHNAFIAQDVLISGTVGRSHGFQVIDILGVRDTPGFGVAGFDVTATSNNPTGVSATIRHGTNAKTFHALAGNTDAGAVLTSGGARSDFECPVFMRQADDATSRTTGALVLTDGGIGCDGSIFGGAEVSAAAATAVLGMRSVGNTLLGSVSSTSTLTSLTNVFSGTLEFGVSNTAKMRLLSDRLVPVTDDDLFLGDVSHRWKEIFAITATINTSDGNAKTDILPIDDALLDAWGSVQAVVFRFKDAVAEKGDSARIHAGYIAQQVQSALESNGLDGFRYGLLCKDELSAPVLKTRTITRQKMETIEIETEVFEKDANGVLTREMVKQTVDNPLTELLQVFNPDGTPYLVPAPQSGDMTPLMQHTAVMETIQEEYTEEELSGEFLMGLRYEECLVVESAYLRREIARLKA